LTIPEVCELLRLSERTVYDLCRKGKLGGTAKIGGKWRVNRRELLTWLKAGGSAGLRPDDDQGGE